MYMMIHDGYVVCKVDICHTYVGYVGVYGGIC